MKKKPETFDPYPLLMQPVFSERPWGGDRLKRVLGKATPTEGGPFGEAWELSDHPEGPSKVANGPWSGRKFGELLREHPSATIGLETAPERFPLLVKYLDADGDLSLQVHPDDAAAAAIGERGKSECWFIIDCAPEAAIVHGLLPGKTALELEKASKDGKPESLLRRMPIHPGDFVYLPAGTVHALPAGTLVCEIQQASNVTYRLWDWGRKPGRTLHINEGCKVVRQHEQEACGPFAVERERAACWHRLVKNKHFEVETAYWEPATQSLMEIENLHGVILNVVHGSGTLTVGGGTGLDLILGQTWFLPALMTKLRTLAGEGGLRLLASRSTELDAPKP